MLNYGVDAFIVDNHQQRIFEINSTNNTECKFKKKYFYNYNGQGLLPKRFILSIPNITRYDRCKRRCLPIYSAGNNTCKNIVKLETNNEDTIFEKDLLDIITDLVNIRLTKKQKIILKEIARIQEKQTMPNVSENLSKNLNIGKTTVRVILQILRDIGFISCGNNKNKGDPLKLTKIGKLVSNNLLQVKKT